MKHRLLPLIGVLALIWAAYAVVQTHPARERTEPPDPPPVSAFSHTVAAVGLVEASTENISIGSPLGGVVAGVFVTPGQRVEAGDRLFELDTRHLRAALSSRQQALAVARARVRVAEARLVDVEHQLRFAERVRDQDVRAISPEALTRRASAVHTARAEVEQTRSEVSAAEAELAASEVEIDRSYVCAPLDAEVLQVKVRVGEYVPAAATSVPLIVLGRSDPLHVRVDVDEQEGWRVEEAAEAVGHVRGNAELTVPLRFVRFEPFVVPKRSLTGDSTERVDTRVLQVVYRVEGHDVPLRVGQQLDVFIDASREAAMARASDEDG